MGRWYIYLHENHKNQANVGKYTINIPYMDAIGYDKPHPNQLKGLTNRVLKHLCSLSFYKTLVR